MRNMPPLPQIAVTTFGNETVNVRIPFEISAKSMKNHDESRDKLEIAAMLTAIHGTDEGGVTTMDHFVHIFNNGITWMQCIKHFFIMVCKNFLYQFPLDIFSFPAILIKDNY